MSEERTLLVTASDDEIVLTRDFDAPREMVFRAWTDAGWLARWWAPAGFTTPHVEVDPRVGGRFHYCMRSPDGTEYWGLGVYREIVPPERIVYVDSFADEDGHPVPPSRYGIGEDHPVETIVEVTFEERAGGTRVVLRHALAATVTAREGTVQGWSEMLERLEGELRAAA
jgi:uncharacterized protein YndB with AHSA1/START domain